MKKKKEINKKFIGQLSSLAEDIIKIKFKETDTARDMERKFFKVLRKHGIKKGRKSGNGIIMNNFEWTVCRELFLDRVRSFFEWREFDSDNTPKDLMHY